MIKVRYSTSLIMLNMAQFVKTIMFFFHNSDTLLLIYRWQPAINENENIKKMVEVSAQFFILDNRNKWLNFISFLKKFLSKYL